MSWSESTFSLMETGKAHALYVKDADGVSLWTMKFED